MKFILINSNEEDAFAALYTNDKLIISHASDFLSDEERSNNKRKPDKLIHCLKKISDENSIDDIDAVSVTTGPGSFTGIRVGLAIAKGLANGLDKKIIPISNFELTLNRINNVETGKRYCILIAAKLPEYYYNLVDNTGKEMKTGYIQLADLSSIIDKNDIIVGNFDNESQIKHSYFNFINVKDLKPQSESMLELTTEFYSLGNAFDSDKIEPVYIKDFKIMHSKQ